MLKIKTAVISVSDKTGVVDFARFLKNYGVEIISTGGTAKVFQENNIQITPISKITGNTKDEYFDGRMKTISFNYEGALLYKRDNPEHIRQAQELGIPQIDMVVCNLYPFEKVIGKEDVTVDEAIENIDIGGPCMVRAAAKNYQYVAVVVEPSQYKNIIAEMERNNGALSLETRRQLMLTAYEKTADYESAIHTFFAGRFANEKVKRLKYIGGSQLGRYAENWHQKGWLYRIANGELRIANIPYAKQVHGGPLGYNNYLDAEAALQSVLELKNSIAVSIIKHANPCGYATGRTLEEAFERAWQGDPVSAFGGVIGLTRPLDLAVARILGERFVEVVVAPSINSDALEYLKSLGRKKQDLRLLETGDVAMAPRLSTVLRFITGGLLEQETDNRFYLTETIDKLFSKPFIVRCENSGRDFTVGIVTKLRPPAKRAGLYDFALRYIKHLKSNAIGIAREYSAGFYQILGMGCGQPNRKDSVALAGQKAKENLKREYSELRKRKIRNPSRRGGTIRNYFTQELAHDNVVLVSDAFFPFRDGIDNVAKSGVKYIIQPGGSVRDEEVIQAANQHKIAMLFTGVRKFYH
jgi:phosphoribosylaminoimidazolecarboxamide formyltransferase/IMP cyclohydrolase